MIDVVNISDAPGGNKKRRPHRKKTPILDSETPPAPTAADVAAAIPPEFAEEDEPEPKPAASHQPAAPYPPIPPKSNFDLMANYWNNVLTPAQRQQGTIYLYRLHPRMKLVAWRGGRLVNANCEKFNDEDGPISRELIRARRRAGVYLLRLSQRVVKPTCEVSQCELEIRGDYTEPAEMPILDVENLDLDYEGNREYIRVLKSRGVIKATAADNPEGAEDEMSASHVLGSIAEKALDKLGNNQQQQQPAGEGATSVGTELVGLLREQINVNRPAEQQGTVQDHVNSLVTLARSMAPPAVDLKPIMELQAANNEIMREMLQRDVQRAEAAADRARQEAEAYKAGLPQPKSLREQLQELRELDELYRDTIGGGKRQAAGRPDNDEDDEDDEDDDEQTAAAGQAAAVGGFMGLIAGLLPVVNSIWSNFNNTLSLMKNGVPLTPIETPAAAPPAPAPPPAAAPHAAAPATAAAPTTEALEQQQLREQMENAIVQLQALELPMMKAFQENQTGTQFAAWVNQNFGPKTIHIVAGLPKQVIFNMLSSYPPIWNIVGPRIAEFHKFYDDFVAGQAPAAGPVQ